MSELPIGNYGTDCNFMGYIVAI